MAIDMGIQQVKNVIVQICTVSYSPMYNTILLNCTSHTVCFLSSQYEEEGIVDPLKYLCEMRQDRGGIIQTQVRMCAHIYLVPFPTHARNVHVHIYSDYGHCILYGVNL